MKLADVIKQIESSNNKLAVRFEPLFYQRLKEQEFNDKSIQKIKQLHKCNTDTAYMIASTSWGYFQIMGYNLYFYSLTDKTVFEFLFDETEQEQAFEKFTQIKNINFTVEELLEDEKKVRKFAKLYNGDEIGYSKKIQRLLQNV